MEPGQIPKDPEAIKKFSVLTKLQYDRFDKWKDGNFTVVPPTRPVKIEDVERSKQPHNLTRAHLESTIGDPLYPGIEMWWLARSKETVGLRYTLFRVISDKGTLFYSMI
jgi:L-lysine epsilon oxidase C-terminal domain